MNKLLEKMEQCLYELKHDNVEYSLEIKNAILDTEITLEKLIRTVEAKEYIKRKQNGY